MALGGGIFLTQNKVLPGAYMNFVSKSRATATLSDRGTAAIPVELDWGLDGEVFSVTPGELQKESMRIFGYDYTHEKLKPIRDLYLNIKMGHLYRINGGGKKAENALAKAKYSGVRGNDITIVVEYNEEATEEVLIYDVITYLDTAKVDEQTVTVPAELQNNNYVEFKRTSELEVTAGMPLTGGTNGEIQNANYQTFLDKIESFSFNTLGCPVANDTLKALFVAFTKRMRDDVGVKFQCVVHKYTKADNEGIISVENNDTPELVYWVTGTQAGCNVNASNTNKVYDGEYEINTDYTQTQLENGIKAGKFMFHQVDDQVRVLTDINTFISFTDDKNVDFSNNQTIRVLDQIGNDIAILFNKKYLGKAINDDMGRAALWNDIVKHHQELETLRAIEDFEPDTLTVEKGDEKDSVVVTDYVTPVNAMAKLYMAVIVQ